MLIPAGATNIQIKERSPSNNYLAIRNTSNHYYLNGNWRIDFPRPLAFAGSIWHYDRQPQGFAAPDHLTCLGPTNENVYLVLLYQDRNVGVHFEYSVPEIAARSTEPDTYAWTFSPYGECSAQCGSGTQTRRITCNSRATLKQADDSLCDNSERPAETQRCGQETCPPQWTENEWSKCSAPCGGNGTQTRDVKCEEISSTGYGLLLFDCQFVGYSLCFWFTLVNTRPLMKNNVCKKPETSQQPRRRAARDQFAHNGTLEHGKG